MTEKKSDPYLTCPACMGLRKIPTEGYVRFCPACHRIYPETVRYCEADDSHLFRVNPRGTSMHENQDVNGYVLEKLLGFGCFSEVWRARRPNGSTPVALKLLRVRYQNDSGVMDACIRFFREARAVSAIGHPHIVKLLDFGIDTAIGQPYQAFELLSGKPLAAVIRQWRMPQDIPAALRLAIQIAEGMAGVHAAGILHRDLKPSNIFLVDGGNGWHVKILDFGLAKFRNHPQFVTLTQFAAMGTPAYISPEQAQGEEPTEATDIYNFGVMLFEMVTRKLPFRGQPMNLMQSHVSKPAPDPRTVEPHVPEALARVILKAMEKRPEDRFDSMKSFGGALAGILASL